jgi:hypothetical protein
MPELWTPGVHSAPLEELLERLHRQIEAFGDQTVVDVELHDGARYTLESLGAEPGFGFVTLRPHPEAGEARSEVIVPLGSIMRITLRPPEQKPGFGFSLPPARQP